MHSSFNVAAYQQTQRARRDRPILAHEGMVRLIDARRMGGDGAAVQQVPRFAVCINRPSADDPGVTEIHSVFAWPFHLPVGIGDQYRLSLMDRDLRRPDLNFGCHLRGLSDDIATTRLSISDV